MLILTPIAKEHRTSGPDSKRDYEEQLERVANGGTWMWDDVSPNRGGHNATVGDDFGFVFNGEKVRVHKVTEVLDPSQRIPSWAPNVGQSNRDVLVLSGMIREYLWDEWLALGGLKKVQGTIYARHVQL